MSTECTDMFKHVYIILRTPEQGTELLRTYARNSHKKEDFRALVSKYMFGRTETVRGEYVSTLAEKC